MTTANGSVIPFPTRQRLPTRCLETEQLIAEAILERRLLNVVYPGAVEPQTFAPHVLYFGGAQQVLLGGCEITKKRREWRVLEVAQARGITSTQERFTPAGPFSSKPRQYPHGVITAVDVRR